MRPVRSLALTIALLAVAPAFAQDSFPDVPRNHWAYAALLRMKKDGLLVGYPDGLYRGGRPMSRYELAVALHAAYTNLKNQVDGIDAQIRALTSPARDDGALKDTVQALKAQLLALRGLGADLADLQRASDTFELELNQLGVDAQAMKDELRGLAGRVRTLEAKEDPLTIGGRIDLWLGGGHGDGDHYGLNRDGRLTGTSDKGPQAAGGPLSRVGITDDADFLSEAAFDFATRNATGVNVKGTLVATDALGQSPVGGTVTGHVGFGNQSDVFNPTGGTPLFGYAVGTSDVYLQTLDFNLAKATFDLDAGRIQHQATPWILRRIDNTLYFDNPRWDDGNYTFDGARFGTGHGPLAFEAYGGTERVQTVNGVLLDPLRAGPANGPYLGARLTADRLLGATVRAAVRGVTLRGDALVLDSDANVVANGAAFDQLVVFGGEVDADLGRFHLEGGLRQSQARDGSARVEGIAGNAWDAKIDYRSGRFDLWAQVRQVQTEYLAPGDWGRLGVLRDPTNVRGGLANAKVALTPRLALDLEGEISHGLADSGAAATFLDRGTDIGRYAVRFDVDLRKAWTAYVRYEGTVFHDLADAAVAGDPRYQWYGVGVAHDVAPNARFTLAYEQSAIRHDYQTSLGAAGEDYRGGFLTTQVTVRF